MDIISYGFNRLVILIILNKDQENEKIEIVAELCLICIWFPNLAQGSAQGKTPCETIQIIISYRVFLSCKAQKKIDIDWSVKPFYNAKCNSSSSSTPSRSSTTPNKTRRQSIFIASVIFIKFPLAASKNSE